MPKLSVIIPCYNHGQYIDEAVNSVLDQTYQDFEIIIVNDGSTDEFTNHKLSSYQWPKTKVIYTKNQGLAKTRNTGIRNSTGKYILPLDADDKIGQTYLEKGVKLFEKDPQTKIVYCKSFFFGANTGEWRLPEFSFEGMLRQNLIFCSAIFQRVDFENVNGYNPIMKYGWEDWDLWLKILANGGNVIRIPEVLFFYRKHVSSMVNDINIYKEKRQYLEQQLFTNHINLYRKYFPEPLSLLRELYALREEKLQFEHYRNSIYNSFSYKLGNFLLKPFKWVCKR